MTEPNPQTEGSPAPSEPVYDRRTIFEKWLGLILAGAGGLAAAVPIVGYLMGPLLRRKPDQWVRLGSVDDFPVDETRVVDFRNPDAIALDGETGKTAAYVRHLSGADLPIEVSATTGGVRVDQVIEDSALTGPRGLLVGDVILKIDDTPVPDPTAYATILLTRKPGDRSRLLVRRGSQEIQRRVILENRFLVLAINCTHLGCPVSWFPSAGLFLCPCHGGVYYEDGARASGPPPRGLYHYLHRINDGQLSIRAGHMPTLHNTMKDIT